MTLDKAIKYYKEKAEGYERQIRDEVWEPDSLSEHNCIKNAEECRQLVEWLKELKRLKEQQPCDDCINRKAAIDAISHVVIKFPGLLTNRQKKTVIETINLTKNAIENALIKMPSVEPERKAGHWIRGEAYPHHIYCSECYKTFIPNDEFRVWANGDIPRKYCPECGAPMEVKTDHS